MKRREFLVSGCALVAGLMAGCGRRQSKTPQSGPTRTVSLAQWGAEKYLIYLPLYLAQETGFFSKRNIQVKLTYNGNDDQVFAAVARGDADLGLADPTFAAISRNRGGDGVVLAQIVDRVALWGVAEAGAPARTKPADFSNTKIGTFPRPSTTYTLLKDMIDKNHVPGATIVEVPIGSELALLERGAADLVMLLEPAASVAVSQGYVIVTSFPDLWGPFAFTGLTATSSWANANRSLVSDVKSSIQDALDLAHKDFNGTLEIAARLFPTLKRAVVQSAVARMLHEGTLPAQIDVNLEGWSAAVMVREEMGQLKTGIDYQAVVYR